MAISIETLDRFPDGSIIGSDHRCRKVGGLTEPEVVSNDLLSDSELNFHFFEAFEKFERKVSDSLSVRGAPYSSRAGPKPLGQKDRIVRDSAQWSTTNLYTLPLTLSYEQLLSIQSSRL
jgi:hypothetical protein